MTEAKKEYLDYLETDHWSSLKGSLYQKHGKKCEACGSTKRIHAHHLEYLKPLTLCTIEHLMPLCESCHNGLHKIPFIVQNTTLRPTRQERVLFVRSQIFKICGRGNNPNPKKSKKKRNAEKRRMEIAKKILRNEWRGYRKPKNYMTYEQYQQSSPDIPIWEKPVQHRRMEPIITPIRKKR